MRFSTVILCALLAAGCDHGPHHEHVPAPAPAPTPRLVSIELEAYDPVTNLVWEGVSVRLVDAWVEWSGLIVVNPDVVPWNRTDEFGIAYFTAAEIGDARIGFVEDSFGRALLEPDFAADEASILVELSAPGFRPLYVEVDVSWDLPDVFVSIPFEP